MATVYLRIRVIRQSSCWTEAAGMVDIVDVIHTAVVDVWDCWMEATRTDIVDVASVSVSVVAVVEWGCLAEDAGSVVVHIAVYVAINITTMYSHRMEDTSTLVFIVMKRGSLAKNVGTVVTVTVTVTAAVVATVRCCRKCNISFTFFRARLGRWNC